MIWEVDTKFVGEWIEAKIVVARDDGGYSWIGQLVMRPDEWQEFVSHLGLRQCGNGSWRSGGKSVPASSNVGAGPTGSCSEPVE